jgi:hypothetical protein
MVFPQAGCPPKIIAIGFCDDILMSSNKPSFFCSKMASTS